MSRFAKLNAWLSAETAPFLTTPCPQCGLPVEHAPRFVEALRWDETTAGGHKTRVVVLRLGHGLAGSCDIDLCPTQDPPRHLSVVPALEPSPSLATVSAPHAGTGAEVAS